MPTIGDVAKIAGVSLGTVSRVINGKQNVHPATREKVELAIQELNFIPSHAARSLRSKQTHALALLVPDITNPFWTTVARGVEDTAQSGGYSVLLCNTDENPAKQLRYLDLVIRQRVDGVMVAPYDADADHLAKLRSQNLPTVILDRRVEHWEVDSVCADSVAGSIALIQHLIDLGHRAIAMISGPGKASTAQDRVLGYTIAFNKAGLSVDPRFIRYGEYRASSGEEQITQLFHEGLHPTAVFAANNAIALGVLDGLEKRGLSVPKDIALVCFDELPDASRFFPFLTVVAQPAYEMGVNAGQLLLSRIDAKTSLKPRHVVLPSRLILRDSCGRTLKSGENGHCLSLPVFMKTPSQVVLVKPLSEAEKRSLTPYTGGMSFTFSDQEERESVYGKPDVKRLLQVFKHEEADRVPHLEFSIPGKHIFEYVLGRRLEGGNSTAAGGQPFTPGESVEFAQRLGIDAVACSLSWQPNSITEKVGAHTSRAGGPLRARSDLEDLPPPIPLASQLGILESYLRAAQGTRVGIFACFTSSFESALLAAGIDDTRSMSIEHRSVFEKLMDALADRQERVIRGVCDRFAGDLSFVAITVQAEGRLGLFRDPRLFEELYFPRMARLIAPVKEHGILAAIQAEGDIEPTLPILYELGFDIIHPVDQTQDAILETRRRWSGKLSFIDDFPGDVLANGDKEQIEEKVKEYCRNFAPGGGWALSSSKGLSERTPAESYVILTRAIHKFGRFGSLGYP